MRKITNRNTLSALPVMIFIFLFCFQSLSYGQFTYKWMSVGSLHNWYSESGCEIEHGRYPSQQDGLRWPAIYDYQDCQAAKGLWIGARNFTDQLNDTYSHKVVHVGPRTTGVGEVFPVEFSMYSKFDPPKVFVDGVLSFDKQIENDGIDPTMPWDREIVNVVNTQLGLTMDRRIRQFSTAGHDNYIIYDYTFTNTGNVDDDPEIELEGQTLDSVYIFFQYRYSVVYEVRYLIHNSAGWGKNSMNSARGDGLENPNIYGDSPDEDFRAQFTWHGYHPEKEVSWDNIGAPILRPDNYGYISDADTVGRIGAPQFVGILTIHADKAADDETDDPAQPSTTGYYGSDEDITRKNDPYNETTMRKEYGWMTRGHMERHAWVVEPSGDFAAQKNHPALDTPGGYSVGNGYGPYQLGFGEEIHIVMAEAANGLSTERCIEIGKQYKNGDIDDHTKNELVLTGRDSLFKTFRMALENYNNEYNITQGPRPPKLFEVNGGGDRISLRWEVYQDDPNLDKIVGFRIYRNAGIYNSPLRPPQLIYEAGKNERSFDDTNPVRGIGYYYYIETVDENGLTSSRYYTQTYDPTFLKRPQGGSPLVTEEERYSLDAIRIVPNPYVISSSQDRLRFGKFESDKLAFFNLPGQCVIKIFTESGELVNTIMHTDGSGDAYWNAVTSSNQLVVSGVYIAYIEVLEDQYDSEGKRIFSKGDNTIIKFVIVR